MNEYRVVEANLQRDGDAIVGVWSRNLVSHTAAEHRRKFDWNYLENPCGPGRCWLLQTGSDARIVGTAGLGFRWLQLDGKRTRVGLASDFAVDKEHRSVQPALLLQRAVSECLGAELPLIYGLPNQKSLGIFQRVGYQSLGVLSRSVKLLRVGKYLRTQSGVLKAMAGLAPAIDVGLRIASAYTWRRAHGRIVREQTGFDERFDRLWQQASNGYAVAGVRTAEFLRWRFSRCPLRRYRILELVSTTDDQLQGYAVCYLANEQYTIADLLIDGSPGATNDLLAGVLAWARRQGASSVAIDYRSPEIEPHLRRLNFVARAQELPQKLLAKVCTGIPEDLLQRWYFTAGDEDYN